MRSGLTRLVRRLGRSAGPFALGLATAVGIGALAQTPRLPVSPPTLLTDVLGHLGNLFYEDVDPTRLAYEGAKRALVAASAFAASDDFFNKSPPMRVTGPPPFNAATTQTAGTATDTVAWYTGETGTDPARGTSVARIDQSSGRRLQAQDREEISRRVLTVHCLFLGSLPGHLERSR